MKIISKYNDYYDAIMRMGYDEHIIFKREGGDDPINVGPFFRNWRSGDVPDEIDKFLEDRINEDLIVNAFMYANNNISRTAQFIKKKYDKAFKKDTYEVSPILVGFCGKFFIIYEVDTTIPKLPRFIIDKDDPAFKRKGREKSGAFKPIIGETPEIMRGNPDEVFLTLGAPIFVLEFPPRHRQWKSSRLILNPVLRKYDFQRIYDPYSAYQELSMYFGSVFANDEDHMVNVSDPELAKSKGFDKWSFKKMPQKKRE